MNIKKSASSGEYMIGVKENNSIEVYRIYDKTPTRILANLEPNSANNSVMASKLMWAVITSTLGILKLLKFTAPTTIQKAHYGRLPKRLALRSTLNGTPNS